MKIIVREKKTLEEVMRVDYFTSMDIDYKIAAIYSMNCISLIESKDASDLMEFILGLRQDAMAWVLPEVEKVTLSRFETMFQISFEDVGGKIQGATEVSDLFN